MIDDAPQNYEEWTDEKKKEHAKTFDYKEYSRNFKAFDKSKMSEIGLELLDDLREGNIMLKTALAKHKDEINAEDKKAWYNVSFNIENFLPPWMDYIPWLSKVQPRCTATAKNSGRRCNSPARNGYSVCHKHGGGSNEKPGGLHKYKRDIYQLEKNTDLAKKAERYLNDERLDDFDSEISHMMALYATALEKAEQDQMSPRALADILNTISKAKKRKKDVEAQSSLSMKQFQLLMSGMHSMMEQYVPKEKHKAFIADLRGLLDLGNAS